MVRRGDRGSEWLTIRRCLVILRRLLKGPASAADLIEAVRSSIGEEAYPLSERACLSAFKHDREHLRHHLEVEFYYDPSEQVYVLQDPGPYGYLDLSLASLQALRLLGETFVGGMGELSNVKQLLDELIERLSPEARRGLESQSLPIDLQVFQRVDTAPLSERVWAAVRRAVREHRKLAFNYLSPQQADRQPRYHEVAPYRIRFQRGHWYLQAYDLYRRNPNGKQSYDLGYRRFRLGYIIEDDKLAVLPTILPQERRSPPRYRVHYRLLPALGRGAISRHFEEMHVTHYPDGSAEVVGYTDDDWEAARILLCYGEQCVVLGGAEVLRWIRQAVKGMAHHYGFLEAEEE